jgi:hypothetical protein
MSIFSKDAPPQDDQHFIVTRAYGGYEVGMHIRCIGEPYDWLARFARLTTDPWPNHPDDIRTVNKAQDEADARMVAETIANASKPPPTYSRGDVTARLGVSDGELAEMISHLGCPRPRTGYMVRGVYSERVGTYEEWDAQPFDQYMERVERLLGFNRKRK